MICHIDNTPMKTVDGSEKGKFSPDHYVTEEIKVCPTCGRKVRERYEAKLFVDEVQLDDKDQSK